MRERESHRSAGRASEVACYTRGGRTRIPSMQREDKNTDYHAHSSDYPLPKTLRHRWCSGRFRKAHLLMPRRDQTKHQTTTTKQKTTHTQKTQTTKGGLHRRLGHLRRQSLS